MTIGGKDLSCGGLVHRLAFYRECESSKREKKERKMKDSGLLCFILSYIILMGHVILPKISLYLGFDS